MAPRHSLILAVALLAVPALPRLASAQAYLPEDNLAYPVQVLVEGGGGTGFFVRRDRELLLVTARHVLFDQGTGRLLAREFTLRALSKDVKETAVTVMHVNGAQLQESQQIRTDDRRDVAVLRLGTIGIATQFVPVPEDVVGVKPGESILALGNSGYGVVASADTIIELISQF